MAKRRRNFSKDINGAGAIVPPTPQRIIAARALGNAVERLEKPIADSAGAIARPYRNIDVLGVMLRRGSITDEMRDAGERFRADFAKAHINALRAGDLFRTSASYGSSEPGLTAVRARDAVWGAIQGAGGLAKPAGSILWHVVGLEQCLKEWSIAQGWNGRTINPEVASGILIAALGMLDSYYNRVNH